MTKSDVVGVAATLPPDVGRSWRWWSVATAASAAFAVLTWLTQHRLSWWMTDTDVYQAAGRLVLHGGGGLYDFALPNGDAPLSFNYPPFAALVLTPFAPLPNGVAAVLLTTLKLLVLTAVCGRTLDLLRVDPRRRTLWTVVAVLALATIDPVVQDLQVGNINVFLLVAFLDLTSPKPSRWRGVGTGLAIGLKVTPALFVLYLLLTKQFRAARNAVLTFAATVVLGLVLLPAESVRYWTSALWDTGRVFPVPGFTGNQSLHGVLLRLLGPGTAAEFAWLVLAVLTVTGGLALAAALHRAGHALDAVVVCAVVILLVTPISWSHHWVWGAPAILVWWTRAWRARSVRLWAAVAFVVAMFSARLYVFATPNLDFQHVSVAEFRNMSPAAQLMSASLVAAGCALLALADMWRRRSSDAPA